MIHSLFFVLASSLAAYAGDVSVANPPANQFPLIAIPNEKYDWAVSADTFGDCDTLRYSTSSLPTWLSFNPTNLAFSGVPAANDEGRVEIELTAQGCGSSASTRFDIPVKPNRITSLRVPIEHQFNDSNPSLSSVFLISPNSALATTNKNPSLRTQPQWSFSVGFDGGTYAPQDTHYAVIQADGAQIPDWMEFNPHTLTLNGISPGRLEFSPLRFSLLLLGSDEAGYSAIQTPFDLVIASHDLSLVSSLPTINMTVDADFNISLSSSIDLLGIRVDGDKINPEDIGQLSLNVGKYSEWLHYDEQTRTLAGRPPASLLHSDDKPSLSVQLTTSFNQSLSSTVLLAPVPSYFIANVLAALHVHDDGKIQYSVWQDCSNATGSDTMVLAATFSPRELEQFLQFDPDTGQLSGTIPNDLVSRDNNKVTFIAYDTKTHSTSHASLPLLHSDGSDDRDRASSTDSQDQPSLSPGAKRRLALGLGITFGIIGGFGLLGAVLACFRSCARVSDTALVGEEGRVGWSQKDKEWYGVDDDDEKKTSPTEEVAGYGWSERQGQGQAQKYGDIGLGLRRVPERSQSAEAVQQVLAPNRMMSKREFVTRIRDTVRKVSDQLNPFNRPAPQNLPRLVIGKPTLIPDPSPTTAGGSTVIENSPAETVKASRERQSLHSLTGSPGTIHIVNAVALSPHGSSNSLVTDEDAEDEAVVQTAARAMSVRSLAASEGSRISDLPPQLPNPHGPRPTLVPFTSALRVPAPHTPPEEDPTTPTSLTKRINSQTAFVVDGRAPPPPSTTMTSSQSQDDLSMGLHYVNTLGEGAAAAARVPPVPSLFTVSTNIQSSFSSLPSSNDNHHDSNGGFSGGTTRMIIRTGEQFKFRVPLRTNVSLSISEKMDLVPRLMTGGSLPAFLHVDLHCPKYPQSVEFYGVPLNGDEGELEIGLFNGDDDCVGRLSLEILGRG